MVIEKSPARLGSLKIPSPPSTHLNMNFRGPVPRHHLRLLHFMYILVHSWCPTCSRFISSMSNMISKHTD
jgi:hypothetical protein